MRLVGVRGKAKVDDRDEDGIVDVDNDNDDDDDGVERCDIVDTVGDGW